MIEVYPHPAHIRLFDLEKILKYKKGRAASRRTALDDYRTRLKASLDENGFRDTGISIGYAPSSDGTATKARSIVARRSDRLEAAFDPLI